MIQYYSEMLEITSGTYIFVSFGGAVGSELVPIQIRIVAAAYKVIADRF